MNFLYSSVQSLIKFNDSEAINKQLTVIISALMRSQVKKIEKYPKKIPEFFEKFSAVSDKI